MTTSKMESGGYRWRPWKVAAVVAAVILVAVGGVMALGGGKSAAPEETSAADAAPPPGIRNFGPTGSPIEIPDVFGEKEPEPAAGIWSPALLRGGISFFVAFAIAFAFRSFVRLALIFVGVWAASLFLLASLGWIEVHWNLIDTSFRGWTATLGDQFRSLSAFITGSLPSAGMAGLGLFTGFRKG